MQSCSLSGVEQLVMWTSLTTNKPILWGHSYFSLLVFSYLTLSGICMSLICAGVDSNRSIPDIAGLEWASFIELEAPSFTLNRSLITGPDTSPRSPMPAFTTSPAAWSCGLQNFNTAALAKRASKLRNGTPCVVHLPDYQDLMMGTRNYHLDVEFEDGVTWIARIRQPNTTPLPVRNYMIKSEAATLGFLEKTEVPAPRVFDYRLDGPDNPVGVGYIFMDKLPGVPLRWDLASKKQRRKVLDQLADIYIELGRHPFKGLGSLDTPGSDHIGRFAKELTFDLPPCQSWREYCTRYILHVLRLIERSEIYTQRPVDAFLIHRFLLDLVSRMAGLTGGWDERFPFYLKHADEKMDHILVDEEYNITGIIDWESAFTAPAFVAFNTPMGILPVKDFYDGVDTLGEHEDGFLDILRSKGGQVFSNVGRHGRLLHRFLFCIGFDIVKYRDDFETLFQGLREGVGADEESDWDEWQVDALLRYRDKEMV
ncbi:hypothetical protein QC762_610150 [Podospora pseudocomata]|uniref:Aminoglycoside phosphotransferase domain-containing protein n=1 Tax=Podospora pseudocomata TaxID=2093779 RepID=A0ABR0G9H0_9PEZI|nr:hypothetical protein QC762_610150 [Podospora pseudocomata]